MWLLIMKWTFLTYFFEIFHYRKYTTERIQICVAYSAVASDNTRELREETNVSLQGEWHKGETQYVHFRSYAEYSLLPWKIREEINRRSIDALP